MGLQLPPQIASLLVLACIAFLFFRDFRERPNVSAALWIPTVWLVVTSSRSVSFWLYFFGLPVGGAISVEEGSPVDASFYFALMAAGLMVLNKRQVSLPKVMERNRWMVIFLLYCLISVCWSDYPFIAFKRWIKVLGLPIMALVILTDPNREEAVRRLMKRCSYIIVPVSVLFIKFYPEWGRSFDPWTGDPMSTGITDNKNSLGVDCLILGFFYFWHWLVAWHGKRNPRRRQELFVTASFLCTIVWLLSQAHSATANTSLAVSVATVLFVGMRSVNKRRIGGYLFAALILIIVAEWEFDASARFSESLGRGSHLSGRTLIWQRLLNSDVNPIVGEGFESFWLGLRPAQVFSGLFFYIPNEAHNGYLEIYITLGLVGLILLLGWFVDAVGKIRIELFREFELGRYRLGFFAATVLYNWTEAGFKTIAPMSFMFYLIAIDYTPPRRRVGRQSSTSAQVPEPRREFAYAEPTTFVSRFPLAQSLREA